MFSKILKIITPIILISIILLIAYTTYQKTLKSIQSPITVIPSNAAIIIKLNNVNSFSKSLELSNIWSKLENIRNIEDVTKNTKDISNFISSRKNIFSTNRLFLSFHKASAGKSASLYSTNLTRKNKLTNHEIINLFANDITISEYDDEDIYFSESLMMNFSFRKDILFFSNNKMLLTDAIRTSKNTENLFNNLSFSNSYKTISNSADINLMINYNNLLSLSNIFLKLKIDISEFSEWCSNDVKFKDHAILSNGLSVINNSVNNFTDIFKGQKSKNLDILNIIPASTTKLFAISFNNQQKIYKKKNKIKQNRNEFWNWEKYIKSIEKISKTNYYEFLNEIDCEAGIFNTSNSLSINNTYTYFNTKESIRATSLLQGMIISTSEYKEFMINKINDSKLTSNLFGDLFKANTPFFTVIKEYFVFGNSTESLEYIIDNYTTKNSLSNNKSFKNLSSYITNSSNIFFYLNPGKTAESLKNNLINKDNYLFNADSIAKFTAVTLQINTTKNGLLHNLCLFHDNNYKESINEEWHYPLDTNSIMNPQFVKNHFTKEKIILIQDNFNSLIAINSKGNKIWSKQIDSKIIGEINSIDFYKNNKFQSLFNTSNKLYLIDRTGKFVDGFPKRLPYSTSFGHSLFDYSNNKNYRIIITGNDNMLYNIDKKGKKIIGWKYKKTNNQITKSPIHFVINNNDYILNATNNTTTKLLARNGSNRVLFKDNQSFITKVKISNKGMLYAINSDNKLWTTGVTGNAKIIEFSNINDSSKVLAYDDCYYISHENSISYINSTNNNNNVISLDSPVKTINQFHKYISITTNKSLYLIKGNKIVEGFPIDSDGYFNISDIDNNGKMNVINLKNGFIYNYELDN